MMRLSGKTKSVSVAAVLIFGIALMTGCGGSKKADKVVAEKAVEKTIEKATGGKAKVDLAEGKVKVETKEGTAEFSSSAEWPADLPGVPKFTYGKVKSVNRMSQEQKKSWAILLEEIEAGALNKYLEDLKASEWKIVSTMSMESGGMIQATKDKVMLVLIFNQDGKSASLSVSKSESD